MLPPYHRPMTPPPTAAIDDYLHQRGFWLGAADYDFWYAQSAAERFWLHVRRSGPTILAVALFYEEPGPLEIDLYDLSRAPVHGLRSSIVNTPLMTLDRFEPPLPLIALRLRDGRRAAFTLAHPPSLLADQWLDETLQRLFASLADEWQRGHHTLALSPPFLRELWPAWVGPPPF